MGTFMQVSYIFNCVLFSAYGRRPVPATTMDVYQVYTQQNLI